MTAVVPLCGDWITGLTCPVPDGLDEGTLALVLTAVTEELWEATGRRWPGTCELDVRPVLCGCVTACRCWPRLDLSALVGGLPIVDLAAVTVDGVDVPEGAWRLDNQRWLTALWDGPLHPWPRQRLDLDAGTEGTWSLTLTAGGQPPAMGLLAADQLACNVMKQIAGKPCDLPDNAVSVSENGVTIALQRPASGRWGLTLVDNFLDRYPAARGLGMPDPAARHLATLTSTGS